MGLEYSGRLLQNEEFIAWAKEEGKAVVERVAERYAIPLFTKRRARKDMLESLKAAAASRPLTLAVSGELHSAFELLGRLAESIEENEYVAAGRTYLIPRFWYNRAADRHLRSALQDSAELRNMIEGDDLREVYFRQLLRDLDEVMADPSLQLSEPRPSTEHWLAVKVDTTFSWGDPQWPGHHYMFQARGAELEEHHVLAIQHQVDELDRRLGLLSEAKKEQIVRVWHEASIHGLPERPKGTKERLKDDLMARTGWLPKRGVFCTPWDERVSL